MVSKLPSELPIDVAIQEIAPKLYSRLRDIYGDWGHPPSTSSDGPAMNKTKSTFIHNDDFIALLFIYNNGVEHLIRMERLYVTHSGEFNLIRGYIVKHTQVEPDFNISNIQILFKDYESIDMFVDALFNAFKSLSETMLSANTQFAIWQALNRLTDAVMLQHKLS